MLNEHPGIMDEHVCVPLVNLFRSLTIVILEDCSGPVEAKELVKEPHNPR